MSSKAWGPLTFASGSRNSSEPLERRLGKDMFSGRVKLVRISPSRRPRTGTSTERNSALYPASVKELVRRILWLLYGFFLFCFYCFFKKKKIKIKITTAC